MSRLPEAGPSLLRRIRQQERAAGRQSNASPFSRSGSGVTDEDELTVDGLLRVIGQMVVDGTLIVNGEAASADFDGNLAMGDAGTTGWAMNASRVAIGELILRPGSLGNDLLTSPVVMRSGYSNTDTGLAVPATATQRALFGITVPTGYTDGAFFAAATAGFYNNTAATVYAYLRVYAAGPSSYLAWGARQQIAIPAGYYGTATANLIREYDVDLAGGTVQFYAEVSASSALTSHASNYVFCEARVDFTR